MADTHDDERDDKRDDNSWTFVVTEGCAECGAPVHTFDLDDIADALREAIEGWLELLDRTDGEPGSHHRRPDLATWSAIEYANHVSDVIDVFQERVFLALTEDRPQFSFWDPHVEVESYDARSVEETRSRIEGAGARFCAVFDTMSPSLADRVGLRFDGLELSVRMIARYVVHEAAHHLFDAEGAIAGKTGRVMGSPDGLA